MKKLILALSAICVMMTTAYAADFDKNVPNHKMPPNKEQMEQHRKAHEAAFEQKLELTEVQKLKAREQRKQNFEKIKPVMEQLKVKRQEAEFIRNSKISVTEKEEKLTVLDNEISELQKQAKDIRKQNMKDFESILTSKQKKTLKQMKKEGRKNFDAKRHQAPPPPPIK